MYVRMSFIEGVGCFVVIHWGYIFFHSLGIVLLIIHGEFYYLTLFEIVYILIFQ